MAEDSKARWSKHAEKAVPLINYRERLSWTTVRTLEQLKQLLSDKDKFAFDTETTSLNVEKAKVVGFSFAYNGRDGYYVPVGHLKGENAPRECLDYVVERVCEAKTVLAYNKKYDLDVLELGEGYNIGTRLNVYDVQGLVWLRDTDITMPSLKDASEHFLGIQQPRISDVMGDLTFAHADIDESTEYASLDAICTYALAADTMKKHPDLKTIFKIDNMSIEAVRKFEHEALPIDVEFLKQEEARCLEKIAGLKQKIFDYAGHEFNMNSDRQVAAALMKAGAVLTEKTKPSKTYPQGQWKVSMDVLEKLEHEMADMLVEYSKEFTYYNNFIRKMLDDVKWKEGDKIGRMRFNYKCMSTVTGRFSSAGGSRKKVKKGEAEEELYYAKINAQNIPKPKEVLVGVIPDETSVTGWRVVDLDEVGKMEGDEFVPDHSKYDKFYVTESGSYDHGVRSAFLPEEDHVFVSIDYEAEELRIAANMSQEPVWVDAFLNHKDIHFETAYKLWGEHADRNDRKKAKSANFGLLYGGSDYTLHQNLGIPRDEAKSFYGTYTKALPTLARWKDHVKRQAKRDGVVYSAFGRPYRLAKFFTRTASYAQQSYGERCALNYPVQGSGGDVIRLALGKILRFREKYPKIRKAFRFISQVHDEINFSVHKKWLHSFMKTVPRLMYMNFEGWMVPLEVDVGIGDNWGRCISYTYDQENKLFTPKGEYYVREEKATA